MNWNAGLRTACLLALTGGAFWGGMGLTKHVIVAFDNWGSASPAETLKATKATLTAINAPCIGFHGSVTCGPLAQLSQTEKNIGILAGQSVEQVKQSGILIKGAADNLNKAGDSVTELTGHLSKTADAATTFVQTLAIDSQTANRLLGELEPLVASYTATGNDLDTSVKTFNERLASPDVTIMLSNGAQFTTTAVQLEQKLAQCTLHPTLPCVLKSDIIFGAQVGGYLLR